MWKVHFKTSVGGDCDCMEVIHAVVVHEVIPVVLTIARIKTIIMIRLAFKGRELFFNLRTTPYFYYYY